MGSPFSYLVSSVQRIQSERKIRIVIKASSSNAARFDFVKATGIARTIVFLNDGISVLQAATKAGTSFIFGYLEESTTFQT